MQDAMSTIGNATLIRSNLHRIRGVAATAAQRSGRTEASVTIVAVTKSVGLQEAAWVLEAGHQDLGENRPEVLAARAAEPALRTARWHLIGTYQRRKVKGTLAAITLVHSVHSVALAETVSAEAQELGRDVDCLLQVNVSGEASKQGLAPDAVQGAIDRMRQLPAIRWRGLMTMAPDHAPPAECRRIFGATRELRDRVRDAALPLPELSMGMSRDFVEAILEGATLVRIGTALFQPPDGGPQDRHSLP
jgi:pyridoxal phosphate enzyme (YggS family)